MCFVGGTNKILRNVIAACMLGLPPDIRVDRDVAVYKISVAQ